MNQQWVELDVREQVIGLIRTYRPKTGLPGHHLGTHSNQ